jgi:hypothetical protein
MPGTYTVKWTVNGKTYTQPMVVKMDPRVRTPLPALQQQHDLSLTAYKGRQQAMTGYDQVHGLRAQIQALLPGATATLETALKELDSQAAALEGTPTRGRRRASDAGALKSFGQLQGNFASLLSTFSEADLAPTSQAIAALKATTQAARTTEAAWDRLKEKDLPALNAQLQAAGKATLHL